MEHDAAESRDGRGDSGTQLHIFHIIFRFPGLVNTGSLPEPLGRNAHRRNVPVIYGTGRDIPGRPTILFQIRRKIRIVIIIGGDHVYGNTGKNKSSFHG